MKKIDGDVTEDAFQRIKAMVGDDDEQPDPVKNVNLVFSPEERFAIYDHILRTLNSGGDTKQIALDVVEFLNEHIAERMGRAQERAKGKSPIFRRVD